MFRRTVDEDALGVPLPRETGNRSYGPVILSRILPVRKGRSVHSLTQTTGAGGIFDLRKYSRYRSGEIMNRQKETGSPKVNMASFIQRANDLAVICRRDRAELEAHGLRWTEVEELARLVMVCSDAEARWRLAREDDTKARKELDVYAGECRLFRNRIVGRFRNGNEYAVTGYPVPKFKRSGGRAELVQDLHDCHVLCRTFSEKNGGKAPVDPDLGREALERSRKLSEMYATVVLGRQDSEELKQRRNMLYHRMYHLIRSICACGRHAFSDDPRITQYYSGKQHF